MEELAITQPHGTPRIQQVLGDVVRLLGAVVRRLRTPLLLVCLAPLVVGAALVAVTLWRGGPDVPLVLVLLVPAWIPPLWLIVRRRQLLAALQPPDEAAAQIYAAISSPQVWSRVKGNLGEVARTRPKVRSLGRSIWGGVTLPGNLRRVADGSPRLAPFLPARLRGLALLGASCLCSSAILLALLVVKALTAAVGIG
jgi:hypothetical protein